ncbi:MAG TPA: ABC transporter substrate-binding protein [Longimicrobiaceae bacterium]|nr:ABC transporter substrate-binding protein [Longimicrobiaceae bacterium]
MRSTVWPAGALLLALLAACGGDSGARNGGAAKQAPDHDAQVPEAQRFGGTLVVATIGEIPDVNPLTSTDYNANQWQQYVLFAPLVTYNEKLEPVPWLAKSWEVNADTTELTFHLRDDVWWHDGVRTSAYDVKFSYDLARNPDTGFPNLAFWTNYGEATVPDSFTFKVKLRPHADFMDPWRAFAPAPEHLLKGIPAARLRNQAYNTRAPVGNGPFRFVSHVQGQSWTFEANPRWPRELGGRPYVDRIVYRVIPEPTTLLTELLAGNIDYYVAPTTDQAAQIEQDPNTRLVSFPDRQFLVISWNGRRPLFADVNVRRALTMAIDREGIVKGVRRGYGELANSTVPPFYWNYNPNAGADLKYDPAAARRLLAQAGWRDTNGDGVVEKDGRPFRFTLTTNTGNRERQDITEIVQAQLKAVGVEAQPQVMEWGTLLDHLQREPRDYDAAVVGWVTEFRIDDSDLFSCAKLREKAPFQWAGYCNPAVDRYLDTLPKIANRAAAKPLWMEYQDRLAHDQPFTFLYYTRRLEGVHERMRNVHPDARGDWVGASRWFLDPRLRRPGR